MPGRLIISAHLDDAVLSAWHALSQGHATVVTVFAGTPDRGEPPDWDRGSGAADSRVLMKQRREEDTKVLAMVGATAVHLGFLDSQYRSGAAPRQQVVDALEAIAGDFDEVWLPTGLGHPDHRAVAEAGLAATLGMSRVMYADQPYASRVWGLAAVNSPESPGDREGWTNTVLKTCPLAPPSLPVAHHLCRAETEAKRLAVAGYQSQFQQLIAVFEGWWEDATTFEHEWFWPLPPSERSVSPLLLLPAGRPLEGPLEGRDRGDLFLSVIMRTRGTRPALLREAILGLSRQSRRDFEVLVVAHNVAPQDSALLESQLSELPPWLRERTRRLDADGGNRARPLNVGLAAAAGRYVAILDDDDIALPEWVKEFGRLATRDPGHILRTKVVPIQSDGTPLPDSYADEFDLIDHLVVNRTPVCGLAFPRSWLERLNVSVDESLDVVEDWDLLLRTAPYCGVSESSAVTSQYREGVGGDVSRTVHSATEWEVAMRRVVDKADRKPLLLPPGSVGKLRQERRRLGELEERLAAVERERTELEGRLAAIEREAEQQRSEAKTALERIEAEWKAQQTAWLSDRSAIIADRDRQAGAFQDQLQALREDFQRSTSWRLTTPLRSVGVAARAIRDSCRPMRPTVAESKGHTGAEAPRERKTVPVDYFQRLYAQSSDPWGFATEWYEARKYSLTVAALPRRRYRRGFEPGCSVGVLTELLAARCDEIVAVDVVPACLQEARTRLGENFAVHIGELVVPSDWPDGSFDLIVISELARYLSDADLALLIERTVGSLDRDGHVVLVNHRAEGPVPQSANDVHQKFLRRPQLSRLASHEEANFLLDVFARAA